MSTITSSSATLGTLWDRLVARRDDDRPAVTERFLTIWSRPQARVESRPFVAKAEPRPEGWLDRCYQAPSLYYL